MDFREKWAESREGFLELLRIPSVYDADSVSPEAPMGKNIKLALDYMAQKCSEEGLAVNNYDNLAISASWGEGERVDIVSHLDVVAVADDWDDDPFGGIVREGWVYGRGSQDMKSGAWLTFAALCLAKRSGIVPKREIRLVYGSDEERTMNDMRRYVELAGLPAFAFTPDGGFPMTTGEKGALMWTAERAYSGRLKALDCGIQPNIIPPVAVCELEGCSEEEASSQISALGIDAVCEKTNVGVKISVSGKGAHASRPLDGHSATADLLALLCRLVDEPEISILHKAFCDPFGTGAGMAYDIEPMGKLTVNPGIIRLEDGRLFAMIDCRYPFGVSSAELTEKLKAALEGWAIELPYDDPPTLVSVDDPYVNLLKQAYTEATGRPCPGAISGGVSYSKVFGHSVTFGAVGEFSEHMAHQKNERISESDCISALEIYYRTIIKVAEAEI